MDGGSIKEGMGARLLTDDIERRVGRAGGSCIDFDGREGSLGASR